MIEKQLQAFLRESAGREFAYGSDDCCLWLSDWWQRVHGADPADWLRGTYQTAAEKTAVVIQHRGLQRLVTSIAASAGAARTASPATGDFGLIVVNGQPYGGICAGNAGAGRFWSVRAIDPGVVFLTNPRVLRAWSIHAEVG